MNPSNAARTLINVIVGLATILLGLRFVLKLFSANPDNAFVDWIYTTSGGILAPFRNIFPVSEADGFIIEFSTLFALLVYMLFGMLAIYLVNALTADETVDEEVTTTRRKR